jgi:hydroxyacylglutathione hydrolase
MINNSYSLINFEQNKNKVEIVTFTFNGFQENTYVIIDHHSNCILVDPGCYEAHEREELLQFIEERKLKPLAVVNTHAHIDHVLGVSFVCKHFNIPFYLHDEDLLTLHSVPNYAHIYGFGGYVPYEGKIETLKDQQELEFGDLKFKVFHTPGHCPGHVVLYNEANKVLINGDVLFRGSFGRVDLPGGDMDTLKNSIFKILFQLPEDTLVYCGHGSATNIGLEKKTNYILNF